MSLTCSTQIEDQPVGRPVEHAHLCGPLAAAPEIAHRRANRSRQRPAVIAFVHDEVLIPCVTPDGNRRARVDAERRPNRLAPRLEGVFEEGAAVPGDLTAGVHRLADELAGGIAVEKRARVRLELAQAVRAEPRRPQKPRAVVELPRYTDATHEPHVVAEAVADRHDRCLQPLQTVFPANRQLARVLVFASSPGVLDRAPNPLMFKARKNRKFASTPNTRLKSFALAGRLARQHDGADIRAAEDLAPYPRDGVVGCRLPPERLALHRHRADHEARGAPGEPRAAVERLLLTVVGRGRCGG